LRWGVDSLYLSYQGELADWREAELRKLKALAQRADHRSAKAQLQLGGHFFEVKDKSSGKFAFTLVDDAFMIRLSSVRSKRLPMAYAQVSSRVLSYKTPAEIERELRGLLQELGDIDPARVSRVDLFLDFASDLNMESWDRRSWVTKASAVHQYAEDKTFTGWTVGAGGALMARLYQKVVESNKSGKEYLHGLWREAGWNGDSAVWRLEFEFKREVLGQLGLDGLPSVLEALSGLWSYATTDWLRLCQPSESDQTRSRWPVHLLWQLASGIEWERQGGPLLRTYQPVRCPSFDWLGVRSLSCIASVGALIDDRDFDAAARETFKHAYDSLVRQNQNGLSGISNEQFFAEKVDSLVRKYNLRMNGQVEPEEDEGYLQNPYYRAKQGL
jgi:hypothetical protein